MAQACIVKMSTVEKVFNQQTLLPEVCYNKYVTKTLRVVTSRVNTFRVLTLQVLTFFVAGQSP